MEATFTKQKSGLRPVGGRRTKRFHAGASALAAKYAQVGDELDDEMVANMSDAGLERFGAFLRGRGLEFGEVSSEGPTEHEGRAWVIYPVGNPDVVMTDEALAAWWRENGEKG